MSASTVVGPSSPPVTAPSPTWTGRCAGALGQLFVVVATCGGLAIGGWWFVNQQVDRQLAHEVEAKLAEHLGAGSELEIKIGEARRVEGRGIELRHVTIGSRSGAAPFAEVDEIFLACNADLQDLINGHLQVRHVAVRHPHVRVAIDRGGEWRIPKIRLQESVSTGDGTTIAVEDGTVELVDTRRTAPRPLVLRGIELDLKRPIAETLAAFDWNPDRPWHVRGRCVADPLEECTLEGIYDGATGEFMAKGRVKELRYSPDLVESAPRELGDLLADSPPLRGKLHAEYSVARRAERPGEPPRLAFQVDGGLADGRIDDARLGAPLTDVFAKFRADDQGLLIDEASAKAGESLLYGWVRTRGYGADRPVSFEIRARKFRVGRHLRELAPADWQPALRDYQVEGLVNADIKVAYDGREWTPDVTVQCLDVAFEYSEFPYPLTHGTGYLEFKHGGLKTTQLRGLAAGQLVGVDIRLKNLGADYTGTIDVSADSPVPVDEKLISALDDDCERLVRAMRARGAVTVRAHFERRSPAEPLRQHVRVGIHQAAIQYVHFPYPIERIRGSLVVSDDGWNIEELSGENDTAYVECRGGWTARGRGGDLRLDFLATDVPLDEELQNSLPPSAQRWWTQLRPRGTLDHLTVTVRLPDGATRPEIEATAEKRPARQNIDGRSVTVKPAVFPVPVDNVTGVIRYRGDEITIEQLRGERGRAVLQASGACVVQPDGAWRLHLPNVVVDRLFVDHDLLAALPNGAGHALSRLQISGPLRGRGVLTIEGTAQAPDQVRGGWDVTVDVENGGLQCGVALEQIRGEVRLVGQFSPQGVASRGELLVDSLLCRGVQLSNVRGPIAYSNQQLVLGSAWAPTGLRSGPPRPVTAQVFGGALVADAVLTLGDETTFRTEAMLSDADLGMLSRELMARRRDVVGKASAAARLEGSTRGLHTLRGEGWLKCRDADIDQLPVTGAMLKQINSRQNGQRNLTLSDVDFRVQDNTFYFPRIDFKGDNVTLKGNGEMQFNRAVDLKFYSIVGRDEVRLPVLSPVLAEASRQILEIEVTGTLDEPEVRRHVVPVINEALQQMFPELGERPADRPPLLKRLNPQGAARK